MKRNTSGVLLIAVVFLVLFALNFIFFVDTSASEENEQTGSRSSYRSTPYGTMAFYSLLEESGHKVRRFESPYTKLHENRDISALFVISPPRARYPSDEEIKSLSRWVEAGGRLILVDRAIGLKIGDAQISTIPLDEESSARPLQPSLYTEGVKSVALSKFAWRVTIDGSAAGYYLGDTDSAVLADATVGDGRVITLTDPYIVANNGISQADNVIVARNLLAGLGTGTIAFDEFHHGHGSASGGGVMAYLRGTPVPWMMAQAALLVLLVVYSYGRRFARPLPLRRERRTTNLEFVSSLANITRLARATDLAMKNIYAEFRKRLCRYAGLPSKAENGTLVIKAARRATLDPEELGRLLARCEAVTRGAGTTDAELLSLVSRIRQIESQLKL